MTSGKTPAVMRAEAEAELKPLGQRRIRLLAELEEVETDLWPLVVRAQEVEVSQRRISALTGLSTSTIGKWVRR